MLYNSNMISSLKSLLCPGIVVVGHSNIHILSSNNPLESLLRLLPKLSGEEKILEIIPEGDTTTRSILVSQISKRYTDMGHNVVTMVPNWSVRIKVDLYSPSVVAHFSGEYKAFVEVYNSYQRVVVGVFNTRIEAEEFYNKYYSNKFFDLVYASNKLTRKYYELSKV